MDLNQAQHLTALLIVKFQLAARQAAAVVSATAALVAAPVAPADPPEPEPHPPAQERPL